MERDISFPIFDFGDINNLLAELVINSETQKGLSKGSFDENIEVFVSSEANVLKNTR